MEWNEITVQISKEASEAITEALMSLGAGGVQIEGEQNLFEQNLYYEDVIYQDESKSNTDGTLVFKSYFSQDKDIKLLLKSIHDKIETISKYISIKESSVSYKKIDDEDYANSWKKYFNPIKISDNIIIKPTWENYDKKEDEIIVEIDPGMAFGTGTHETTKMCINLIEKYIHEGQKVLDIGCGSGILSIAAIKVGAKCVTAVDIDPVAIGVTLENSKLNNVHDNIKVITGTLEDVEQEKFDIIVANIIANSIIEISSILKDYMEFGGVFITSGIIRDRKQEVIDAYKKNGFSLKEVIEDGEWVAIVFNA